MIQSIIKAIQFLGNIISEIKALSKGIQIELSLENQMKGMKI